MIHPTRVMNGRLGLDFMIVGTPRSGTTLVQRLVCELPGVRVPPETHFFKLYAPDLLRRRRFPLDARALREEVEIFRSLETSRGLAVDAETIVQELEGKCEGALELFSAIVRHLAGPARIYGEKTPEHLFWWRPLARAVPHLKFIAVVRDPRAVVASNLAVPWGLKSHIQVAERWLSDQRQVVKAQQSLGSDRSMVLRYEEVVRNPDRARHRMSEFLGCGSIPSRIRLSSTHDSSIFVAGEEPWKGRAIGPISSDRVKAWREKLTEAEARDVEVICWQQMKRFGYYDSTLARLTTADRIGALPLAAQYWRFRFRVSRAVRRRQVSRALR